MWAQNEISINLILNINNLALSLIFQARAASVSHVGFEEICFLFSWQQKGKRLIILDLNSNGRIIRASQTSILSVHWFK